MDERSSIAELGWELSQVQPRYVARQHTFDRGQFIGGRYESALTFKDLLKRVEARNRTLAKETKPKEPARRPSTTVPKETAA